MSHTASSSRSDERYQLSRQLHTLVQLLQRVPESREQSGHAAFFDAMRAVLIDVCAATPEPQPGSDALVMAAITQLERRPLQSDPLVFDLLQLLRAHGFLEGERRTQLAATLRRLVSLHLSLFWQESDVPLRATVAANNLRADTVDMNRLNLPWALRPAHRVAEHRGAANEPDAQAQAHLPPERPDSAASPPLPVV